MNHILRKAVRLLTFRITTQELSELGRGDFLFGLLGTWIVGMGRYWDDPGAKWLQHIGAGSVIYIFALALLLWLILWPLRPRAWTYGHVLTFVALTSPPAILYAIPVERFFTMEAARAWNVWFLMIVASWRVALLVFYLKRHAALGTGAILVGAGLPLTAIVVTLTFLNLHRAVFEVMAGLRGRETAHDSAYAILNMLTVLAVGIFIPLLIGYAVLVAEAFQATKRAKGGAAIKSE